MSVVSETLVDHGPDWAVWEVVDDAGHKYLERRTFRANGSEATRERITDPVADSTPTTRRLDLTPLARRIRRERLAPVVIGAGIPKMVVGASALGAFGAVLTVEILKAVL